MPALTWRAEILRRQKRCCLDEEELINRLRSDVLDGYDEEMEMELEDRNIDQLAGC